MTTIAEPTAVVRIVQLEHLVASAVSTAIVQDTDKVLCTAAGAGVLLAVAVAHPGGLTFGDVSFELEYVRLWPSLPVLVEEVFRRMSCRLFNMAGDLNLYLFHHIGPR